MGKVCTYVYRINANTAIILQYLSDQYSTMQHPHIVCAATSAIVGELPEGNMLEDAGLDLSCKSEVYKYVSMHICARVDPIIRLYYVIL